jgi:Putative amidoligase enzyme
MGTWLEATFDLPPNPQLNLYHGQPFLVGVELEIEAVADYKKAVMHDVWPCDSDIDHSLRNNGREFKFHPNTLSNTIEHFRYLHKHLNLGPDAFSERTSIHVHVNCRNYDANQLREIILMYAFVEPFYLRYVGDKRRNSIYCVPLNFTNMPDHYKRDIMHLCSHKVWHKYTAFNILPLQQFGTIEFRHLYGTNDAEVFSKWLYAIKDLFDVINNQPNFNIMEQFQKRVDPVALVRRIVPTLTQGLQDGTIATMIKDSILDVKLAGGGFVK